VTPLGKQTCIPGVAKSSLQGHICLKIVFFSSIQFLCPGAPKNALFSNLLTSHILFSVRLLLDLATKGFGEANLF